MCATPSKVMNAAEYPRNLRAKKVILSDMNILKKAKKLEIGKLPIH
jgi:hypothetical protein